MLLILIELYRYFIKWFFSLDHYRGWAWWVSLFIMLKPHRHAEFNSASPDVVHEHHYAGARDPESSSG